MIRFLVVEKNFKRSTTKVITSFHRRIVAQASTTGSQFSSSSNTRKDNVNMKGERKTTRNHFSSQSLVEVPSSLSFHAGDKFIEASLVSQPSEEMSQRIFYIPDEREVLLRQADIDSSTKNIPLIHHAASILFEEDVKQDNGESAGGEDTQLNTNVDNNSTEGVPLTVPLSSSKKEKVKTLKENVKTPNDTGIAKQNQKIDLHALNEKFLSSVKKEKVQLVHLASMFHKLSHQRYPGLSMTSHYEPMLKIAIQNKNQVMTAKVYVSWKNMFKRKLNERQAKRGFKQVDTVARSEMDKLNDMFLSEDFSVATYCDLLRLLRRPTHLKNGLDFYGMRDVLSKVIYHLYRQDVETRQSVILPEALLTLMQQSHAGIRYQMTRDLYHHMCCCYNPSTRENLIASLSRKTLEELLELSYVKFFLSKEREENKSGALVYREDSNSEPIIPFDFILHLLVEKIEKENSAKTDDDEGEQVNIEMPKVQTIMNTLFNHYPERRTNQRRTWNILDSINRLNKISPVYKLNEGEIDLISDGAAMTGNHKLILLLWEFIGQRERVSKQIYENTVVAFSRAYKQDHFAFGALYDMEMTGNYIPSKELILDFGKNLSSTPGRVVNAYYILSMNKDGTDPTLSSVNVALAACAELGMVDRAFRTYELLTSRGITPNSLTIELLLETLAKDIINNNHAEWSEESDISGLQLGAANNLITSEYMKDTTESTENHGDTTSRDDILKQNPSLLHPYVKLLAYSGNFQEAIDLVRESVLYNKETNCESFPELKTLWFLVDECEDDDLELLLEIRGWILSVNNNMVLLPPKLKSNTILEYLQQS